MHAARDGSMSRLPTISAVNCELKLQDMGSGASIHLPNGRLSVAWSAAQGMSTHHVRQFFGICAVEPGTPATGSGPVELGPRAFWIFAVFVASSVGRVQSRRSAARSADLRRGSKQRESLTSTYTNSAPRSASQTRHKGVSRQNFPPSGRCRACKLEASSPVTA